MHLMAEIEGVLALLPALWSRSFSFAFLHLRPLFRPILSLSFQRVLEPRRGNWFSVWLYA
jgi:hypothetical protein